MAYIYAKINKKTLRFIRIQKRVSFEYIQRIAKFSKDKVDIWENDESNKLPTIRQAKELAKCYRVPFAGLYMNSADINIKHLPPIINKRSIVPAQTDDSAVNLALFDLINARDYYVETKALLREPIPGFELDIPSSFSIGKWAGIIRTYFELNLSNQFRMPSTRKLYLYLREKIEAKGIFIQGFQKVDVESLRGVAIVDEGMPIIGINENDRYPAKSFSIIHELVHIIKRSSSICNDMFSSYSMDGEEVFCNAVAGEVLVPRDALTSILNRYQDLSIDNIDSIAKKFSVSSEVIARRLYDNKYIDKNRYAEICRELNIRFQKEKESISLAVKMGVVEGPRRNISREAVDRTSSLMCLALIKGFSEGFLDKADISAYTRIGLKHVDKFISEVVGWR